MPQQTDYAAIARQFGGQTAGPPPVDYSAMAREFGGTTEARTLDFATSNERDASGAPVVRPPSPMRGGFSPETDRSLQETAGRFLGEVHSLNPREISKSLNSLFWSAPERQIQASEDFKAGRMGAGVKNTVLGAMGPLPKIAEAAFNDDLRAQAVQAFESGDYIRGTGKLLDWLTPFFGTRMSEAADLAEAGEPARAAGAMTDVGVQVAGPKALSTVAGKVSVGRAPRVPANPVEASAVAFARAQDVPLDMATATGSRIARNLQKRAAESLGGSGTVARAQQAQGEALARVGDRLASEANVGRPAVGPIEAAEGLQGARVAEIQTQAGRANTAYEALRAFERKAPVEIVQPVAGVHAPVPMQLAVDLTASKTALKPIYERLLRESQLTPVQGAKGRALTALDRLMNGPDFADLSIVDEALGDLKALSRGAELPELRTQGQGIAAEAVKQLDRQVRERAAAAGPEVLKALEDGRAATKAKYDVADALDFADTTKEPRAVFNRLTAPKDAGVKKLREVRRLTPQTLPDVGRALLEDILEKPTSEGGFKFADKAHADWQKVGSETRGILFPKAGHAAALDDFFLLAKKIGENPNPSGTAGTLSATNLTVGGIPMWALAKVLYSPKAVNLMTRGMRLSISTAPAARTLATAQIAQALREAGVAMPATADEPPPDATPGVRGPQVPSAPGSPGPRR